MIRLDASVPLPYDLGGRNREHPDRVPGREEHPRSKRTRRPERHDAEEFTVRPILLIVEDDPALTEVWRTIFAARGWEVRSAATVAEGLALLEPAPDYLILDLQLPDGDGGALLRRIRETGMKTRVAVTTASDDPASLAGLEPEALFRKPVDVVDVWRLGAFSEAG
ncbi:response regulator transcription factor [Tautonia sociabilis]